MQNSALQYPSFSQNKCLVFRYFSLFLFSSWLVLSSSAFAFGGGGDNRLFDKEWMRGVDAFALHFNGKGELDIKFGCDDKNASPDIHGVCSCNAGYLSENGKCVKDACVNFKATECVKTCTSSNGIATYTYGTTCANGYFCNTNHQCENPCYEDECQTCTPIAGQARWTNKTNGTTCSIGSCQSGTCTNMCANKTYDTECQTCNVATGTITNKIGSCTNGTCQGGTCVPASVDECENDEFMAKDYCFKCTLEDLVSTTQEQCDKCGDKRFSFKGDNVDNLVYCEAKPTGCTMNQEGTRCNCPDGTINKDGVCTSCATLFGTNCKDCTYHACISIYPSTTECENVTCDPCQSCNAENGQCVPDYALDTTVCPDGNGDDNYICQSGNCTDPCDLITNKNPCKDYTPQGGQCVESNKADTTVCPDGNGSDNYICQSGTCTDPCTIGEHATFEPTICFPAHHAENGQCVPDYAPKGTKNCDSEHKDYVCNGSGVCTCPEGQFRRDDGYCSSCSSVGSYAITAEECAVCDNTSTPRMMWAYKDKNYCVLATCPEGQLHSGPGYCTYCSASYSYETTAEACAECDNTSTPRMMWAYKDKNYCALATCPEGLFRRDDGYCSSCSTPDTHETTAEECAECDNTSTPRKMWAYNGENYCVLATCPEGLFRRYDGYCRSCSDTTTYAITAEECAACDNTSTPRKMWAYDGGNRCVLATCPEGRFHLDDGSCYSCSYTDSYETTAEACAECDGTANPRFMGTDDACYICTTSDSVTTTEEACNKCPNRTWTETTPASDTTPATGTCALCPDGVCPETPVPESCSVDNLSACDTAEKCTALGEGYTYSTENGCQAPECTTDTDCNTGYTCESGKCVTETCNGFLSASGKCYDCQEGDVNPVTSRTECDKCAGLRFYDSDTQDSGQMCVIYCDNNKIKDTAKGGCKSCTDPDDITTTKTACDTCENRIYDETVGLCKFVCNTDTDCGTGYTCENHHCNVSSGSCSKDNLSACDETACLYLRAYDAGFAHYYWSVSQGCVMNDPSNICYATPQCPSGSFLVVTEYSARKNQYVWDCAPCDARTPSIATQSACNTCSGRTFIAFDDGEFVGVSGQNVGYCTLSNRPCPSGTYLTELGCLPCTSNGSLDASIINECAKCSNREIAIDEDGEKICRLKTCPSGTFRVADGSCETCDDPEGWEAETSEQVATCNKCSNRKIYTDVYDSTYCVLKTCPTGYYRDVEGWCDPCDNNELDVEVANAADCTCSNRTAVQDSWGDWYCTLTSCK